MQVQAEYICLQNSLMRQAVTTLTPLLVQHIPHSYLQLPPGGVRTQAPAGHVAPDGGEPEGGRSSLCIMQESAGHPRGCQQLPALPAMQQHRVSVVPCHGP